VGIVEAGTEGSGMKQISIADRFCGPPGSGNGGYTAGAIAVTIGEPVKVRLVQPAPMNEALTVTQIDTGTWEARAGDAVIATATAHMTQADVAQPPSWIEAFGASMHYEGFRQHAFPRCFVCGTERAEGDGLRIFAGSVPGTNLLAAPWRPDASLLGNDSRIRKEFVWAALDCPGYFATCSPLPALLGELSVHIDHVPQVDEACVVTAWRIGIGGRKHYAGTALFDAVGKLCAYGVATWIQLKATAAG
jgi:hypothetical protein